MSLLGLLGFALYAVVVAVVAAVLIWLSNTYAPDGLKGILRPGIIIIAVICVLIRLLLVTGTY